MRSVLRAYDAIMVSVPIPVRRMLIALVVSDGDLVELETEDFPCSGTGFNFGGNLHNPDQNF